jgi:hypothetical protein
MTELNGEANSATITLAGQTYAPGDTFTLGGTHYVAVGVERLSGSASSGVAAGVYPVVYETIAGRKAYRVYVDGEFYPVRQYGTPDAIIAKQRESREKSPGARAASARASAHDDGDDLALSSEAVRVLEAYVSLVHGAEQSRVLSELVVTHLGPEIERIRKAQEAIQKLPVDLLTRLAGASDEQRAQILSMLK